MKSNRRVFDTRSAPNEIRFPRRFRSPLTDCAGFFLRLQEFSTETGELSTFCRSFPHFYGVMRLLFHRLRVRLQELIQNSGLILVCRRLGGFGRSGYSRHSSICAFLTSEYLCIRAFVRGGPAKCD